LNPVLNAVGKYEIVHIGLSQCFQEKDGYKANYRAVELTLGGHPAWDFLYIGRRAYERNSDIIGSDWRVDFSAGLPTAKNGRSNLNERCLSGDKKKKS